MLTSAKPNNPIWSQFKNIANQSNKTKCKKCEILVNAITQKIKTHCQ